MTMRNGDEAPAELGWKGSFVFGCGVGIVALFLVGLFVFWRGLRVEDDRRAATDKLLHIVLLEAVSERRAPPADGSGADWTGQRALGVEPPRRDGWGNPVRYRCPGPVHRRGWDLWSCGPNGKDDQGTFDDILIGEDIAPATSR